MLETNLGKIEPIVETLHRIVIGDVGSGKTIVAFLLALSYLHGLKTLGQASFLAPTEVLAFQHYQKLRELLDNSANDFDWLDTVFLTAKTTYFNDEKVGKKKLQNLIENSSKKIFWLGTQALLFDENIKPDLVMVDEQHRFGVSQRQKLSSSSVLYSPHFISFTATPIPRTLALTVFESLSPVFLDRIQGRQHIHTQINDFSFFETELVEKIRQHLAKNRKIYIICSKVQDQEDAEIDELWSVAKTSQILEKKFPKQIMMVHGKMIQKKDILNEFKVSTDKNILVATTVVEVGVDVPEASLVLILNAERFGLSALHQIRGRVGRNNYRNNECILVTYPKYKRSMRLRYLCDSQDGFSLAEKDLELRGGGDALGTAQSGFGDEIDKLIGLNPKLYKQINEFVNQIDMEHLDNLPRLKKFLEMKATEMWKE